MNSVIQQVSLVDSTVTLVLDPGLHNLDGITRDSEGNYYVSSWSTNAVYKFDENFQNPPEIFSTHNGDPADIFFDSTNNVLGVPLFYAHQVDFVCVPIVESQENEIIHSSEIELFNYPNPFNPSTTIYFETMNQYEITQIEIYNLKGQKVRYFIINPLTHEPINSVIWNGTDQSGNPVSSGIYYCRMNIPNSPIKKMILMK